MRVDLSQRKVPESEADGPGQALLDPFDLSKRLTRVRAFAIAIVDDQAAGLSGRGRDRSLPRAALGSASHCASLERSSFGVGSLEESG
jgi:hypothetical protein